MGQSDRGRLLLRHHSNLIDSLVFLLPAEVDGGYSTGVENKETRREKEKRNGKLKDS